LLKIRSWPDSAVPSFRTAVTTVQCTEMLFFEQPDGFGGRSLPGTCIAIFAPLWCIVPAPGAPCSCVALTCPVLAPFMHAISTGMHPA